VSGLVDKRIGDHGGDASTISIVRVGQ
jgi:hypothetical protein